jgi:hypothetical protein
MKSQLLPCPYCGEEMELIIDECEGSHQVFVQDCPVCCRPWQVDVMLDPEYGWIITLRREDD